MSANPSTFNREKAEQFAWQTSVNLAAAMNCCLSYLGDQMGLYRTLNEFGPATSEVLAERTGLHERWLREWLRQQACANQLEYDETNDSFSISREAAAVLCDEDSPYYFAAGFTAFQALRSSVDHLPTAFKTGLGMSFDDHGPTCACGIEKLNNFVPRFLLVRKILPELPMVCEKLESGINVADVGCGSGVALLKLARSYPNSRFYGYEISDHALDRFKTNLESAQLKNVEICDVQTNPLPHEAFFDLICTFDVVHDVPFPHELIKDIRSALTQDGTWLCSDIRSFPTFSENLANNPRAPLMYGFSLLICLSSAMSESGGAGLGTLGFNEGVARKMTSEAGFGRFRKLEYENAMNSYYEIRP